MLSKVAIIDTGIDPNCVLFNNVESYVELFVKDDTIFLRDDPIMDSVGHGTCAAIVINNRCKNTKFNIINIYGKKKVTYSVLLYEALLYLLDKNVDIINISLSVDGSTYKKEIEGVLHKLFSQGKVVVCSVKNGQLSSFPADNNYCIGVIGSYEVDNELIRFNNSSIQLIASGKPDSIAVNNNRSVIFCGSSKAAAEVSGVLANFRAGCTKEKWVDYVTNNKLISNVFAQSQDKR